MPQDPNLYGQRPVKRQKKEISLPSSLTFTSQLTSLLSTSSSSSSAPVSIGRARPSKTKGDIFSTKVKRKGVPESKDDGAKLTLKEVNGTEEEKHEFARAKRKMEDKARLYAAMKRGDYIPKEGEAAPLVDFDRMWAEKHPDDPDNLERYSSSDGDSDEDGSAEIVEYKDEFGRTRRGTRADVARQQRKEQRMALGAEELDRMSARPKAPEKLIYGDAIQSHAFNPEYGTIDKMEQLAAKRDRSPTPPEDTHYDGNHEIRTKGVGFYHFSQNNAERQSEMQNLEQERENTERVRREREAEKERRRKEIEERRRKIGEKRAVKMADNFLDGLAGELAGGSGEKKNVNGDKSSS